MIDMCSNDSERDLKFLTEFNKDTTMPLLHNCLVWPSQLAVLKPLRLPTPIVLTDQVLYFVTEVSACHRLWGTSFEHTPARTVRSGALLALPSYPSPR